MLQSAPPDYLLQREEPREYPSSRSSPTYRTRGQQEDYGVILYGVAQKM